MATSRTVENPGQACAPAESTASTNTREPDPLTELESIFGAIRRSVSRYAQAAADSVRLLVREALIRAFLLISAVLLVCLIASVGTVLLLIGASQALAAAFALPLWGGLLIVGGSAVLLPVALIWGALAISKARYLQRTRQRVAARAGVTGGDGQ